MTSTAPSVSLSSGTSQYADIYWTEAVSNTTENIIAAVSLTAGATLRLR